MAFDLAVVLGFLFISAFMLWVLLFVGRFLRIQRPHSEKLSTYECGERPFGPAWFNFNNRFYILALCFVVFDVMLALAVPVVVVFRRWLAGETPVWALVCLLAYFGFLALVLAYLWRHGDLAWVKQVQPAECRPVEVGGKEQDRGHPLA